MSADCQHDGGFDFDPLAIGTTCGGLALRGWDRCRLCAAYLIPGDGRPRPVPVEIWRVAKSLRSVETGVGRIRTDGGDAELLAARIVHLPDLEELRDIVAVFARTARFAKALGPDHQARVLELLERVQVAPAATSTTDAIDESMLGQAEVDE